MIPPPLTGGGKGIMFPPLEKGGEGGFEEGGFEMELG